VLNTNHLERLDAALIASDSLGEALAALRAAISPAVVGPAR